MRTRTPERPLVAEASSGEIADGSADASPDFNALIASLRRAGVGRFDAVRLHYIEVLANRAAVHRGSVKRMLNAKLAQALATVQERFEQAQCACRERLARAVPQYPHAANDLQRLFDAGDFKGLQRLIALLETGAQHPSLGALVRELEVSSFQKAEAHPQSGTGSPHELKTLRNFRNTWSRLSADRQVTRSLKQGPLNAGPINSHMLVLRSLALMRDISPDYLNRFMSYTDTLLWLEQCEKDKPGKPKKLQGVRAAKK